jgi:hypothetical protein
MLHYCSLYIPAYGYHHNDAPDAESSALANRLVAVGCKDSLALVDDTEDDDQHHEEHEEVPEEEEEEEEEA